MKLTFTEVGPELDDATLNSAEAAMEIMIPLSVRRHLLRKNGGYVIEDAVFHFMDPEGRKNSARLMSILGIKNNAPLSLQKMMKLYGGRIPHNSFPIGEDNCGNLVLVSFESRNHGAVYFWDHEYELLVMDPWDACSFLAESWDKFLDILVPGEAP